MLAKFTVAIHRKNRSIPNEMNYKTKLLKKKTDDIWKEDSFQEWQEGIPIPTIFPLIIKCIMEGFTGLLKEEMHFPIW
ncbi:hypothetical protein GQX74_004273 [Glossina fuscipes]|nr:hypothetical protein GQX74_004273 [Glossina fuscipes]